MSHRGFDFNNVRQSLNKVMEDALQFASGSALNVPVDIVRVEDTLIVLTVPLIGIVPESLDISVSGDVLIIQGKTAPDDTYPESAYIRRERRYGEFQRRVQLPLAVVADQSRAELKNGILKITFPLQNSARKQHVVVVTDVEDAQPTPPADNGDSDAAEPTTL